MSQKIDSIHAYCLKDKQKMVMSDPQIMKTKNNRYLIKGKCSNGHMMNKFVSVKEIQGDGILGSLFGLPGGKIPGLGDIPLLGTLF